MTTKRIVYRRSDGVVEVVVPGLQRMNQLTGFGLSEDEALDIVRTNALAGFAEQGFGLAQDVEIMEEALISQTRVGDRDFRNALEKPGLGPPTVNMPKAREIHADRIALTQATEIARLKIEERKERLKGNTAQADSHAATITALEALDLNVLATQIANAPNLTALSAIWPANVPR